MRVYVGTPCNQLQASLVADMPVLISFAAYCKFLMTGGYVHTFSHLLLDSGAFSELNSGKKIDLAQYLDWVQQFPYACAYAGLDDISGNWERSLLNYQSGGFPTFHDTDPDWLLDELIPISRERGNWIGLGLKPPRAGREAWLRRTLKRIPEDLHVHGWALGRYAHIPRIDSFDSTHAWLEWQKIRNALGAWITSAECMELAVKKVRRQSRLIEKQDDDQISFDV
jgi:hypothetical protein